MEPIVGSGERLCIGVIVSDRTEAIVCAVNLTRLNILYGENASAFILAGKLAIDQVQKQILKTGFTSILEWNCPIEGVVIGHLRQGAGENIQDVAHTALMQCSSLAAIGFQLNDKPSI